MIHNNIIEQETNDAGVERKSVRRPRSGYASKIKSHIKMAVLEKYKLDLVDPKVFPKEKKRWQSFVDALAKDGLADTKHFEEISPGTVQKLFQLFNNLEKVLKSRGKSDYNAKLQLIPAKFHHRLNYLLQYMAQVGDLI